MYPLAPAVLQIEVQIQSQVRAISNHHGNMRRMSWMQDTPRLSEIQYAPLELHHPKGILTLQLDFHNCKEKSKQMLVITLLRVPWLTSCLLSHSPFSCTEGWVM